MLKPSLLLASALLLATPMLSLAAPLPAADPLSPILTITSSPGPGVHEPQLVTLSAEDVGGSGIASVHYTLIGSAEQAYTARFMLSRPGSHLIHARALDRDGRQTQASATVEVTTDSAVRGTPIQGPDRIATAIAGSVKAFKTPLAPDPEGYRTVVLATGYNWPDALGAATLAGALDGPVLLTKAAVLPTTVAAEIVRLQADRVIIVGGTQAINRAVEDTCLMVPGVTTVQRLHGADRYATAIKIAGRSIDLLGDAYTGRAFVATGYSFPDALGASAAAAAMGVPVYLAPPGLTLRDDVATAIVDRGVTEPVILGGTEAVSSGVAVELSILTGSDALRLAGQDRYLTSLAIANWAVGTREMFWDGVALTTGRGFADAVAGGPVQGRSRSVMLLIDPVLSNTDVDTTLHEHRYVIAEVRFLGGEAVMPLELRDAALAAIQK